MSSALVRKALEFVDPEEQSGKRGKRSKGRAGRRGRDSQGPHSPLALPYKRKPNPPVKEPSRSAEQRTEDTIERLLALSRPVTNTAIAEKIVERAIKGKPLLEKIEVKKGEEKSILFPDEEPFKTFEKRPFCS